MKKRTQLSHRDTSALSLRKQKKPQNFLIQKNQTLSEEKQLNPQDWKNDPKNKEKATPSLCQKRKTQLSSRTKEKNNLRRKETPLSQGKEQSQLSHEKQTHPREKPDHLKRKK